MNLEQQTCYALTSKGILATNDNHATIHRPIIVSHKMDQEAVGKLAYVSCSE